jgi:hypothetical protein
MRDYLKLPSNFMTDNGWISLCAEPGMYCNIEEHSGKTFCHAKTISMTYSEVVFVALGIQHAMRMHHIVIYGLFCYTKFFQIF